MRQRATSRKYCAAWALARKYCDLNKPPPQRKRSLEGHVKHKARDRERVQRRRAAAKSMDKGKQGEKGERGKGKGIGKGTLFCCLVD